MGDIVSYSQFEKVLSLPSDEILSMAKSAHSSLSAKVDSLSFYDRKSKYKSAVRNIASAIELAKRESDEQKKRQILAGCWRVASDTQTEIDELKESGKTGIIEEVTDVTVEAIKSATDPVTDAAMDAYKTASRKIDEIQSESKRIADDASNKVLVAAVVLGAFYIMANRK